jgi:CPA2 family monovalent cation:H+ antiporter-2
MATIVAVHETNEFLRNLALVMGVAAITTIVCERLRQPLIFGYILAGVIIGPHFPVPLVADEGTVQTLSELGIILLMFFLGLEFSIRRLFQTGWSVLIVAILETSLMLWFGYETGRLLGWSVLASFYAGAAIAISSTTIIAKTFADQKTRGRFTELVFGILIIEDLIAIVLLALLTPASPGAAPAAASLGVTIVRLVSVLAAFLVGGFLVVPGLVRFVVRLGRPEITLVTCIGICFIIALLVEKIGYSVALGAFLAGSFVSESGEGLHIEKLVEPVRDMFAAIFFVSVGMMLVPALVAQHWRAVLVLTTLVLVGKIVFVSIATFLTGAGARTAIQTGMSMAQVGEFSFIIAGAGVSTGAAPSWFYPVTIAVSAITTLTTPWLIRFAPPVAALVDRRLPRAIQTFAVLYGTWIEGIGTRPDAKIPLRRAARALAIDAGVIAALGIGVSIASTPLGAEIASRMHMRLVYGRLLIAAGAFLVSIPFLAGVVRNGRALGQMLSVRAFPEPEAAKLDLAAAPRRAFVVAIQLTALFVVGAPLVAITQPFFPMGIGFGALVLALAVLGIILWRAAADLQGHVRAAAQGIVETIGRRPREDDTADAQRALERAYRLLPGLGEPVSYQVGGGSPFAGQRLASINLRGRTGATVIAISRGEDVVLVPDGKEVLKTGDVLALVGPKSAIESAMHLLENGAED